MERERERVYPFVLIFPSLFFGTIQGLVFFVPFINAVQPS